MREESGVGEGAIGGSSRALGLPRTTQWLSVGAVLSCGLVAALQLGKVAVFLPDLGSEFRLGLAAQGWVMGIFALMGAFGGALAGAMDSRFDVKHVILIGCLLLTAGSAAGSLATALTPLLTSRVLEGAGFLTIGIAAPALLQRVSTPKAQYLLLALWSTGVPVGMALVLLVGPAFHGWRELWVSTAVLTGISAVLVAFGVNRLPPIVRRPQSRGVLGDARATLTARTPMTLALIFGAYSLQYFAVFSLLPIMLIRSVGVSIQVAGALTAPTVLVNALGNIVAGELMSRGVTARALIALSSLAMGASGAATFLVVGPSALIVACCFIFSATGGLIAGCIFATAPVAAPEPRLTPITVGLIIQGGSIGQVFGPVITGAVAQAFGWHAASAPIAIAAAFAGGLSMLLRRADSDPIRDPRAPSQKR